MNTFVIKYSGPLERQIGSMKNNDRSVSFYLKPRIASCLLALIFSMFTFLAHGHAESTPMLDRDKITEIVNKVAELIQRFYIYEDVGNRISEDIKCKLGRGDYNGFKNIQRLTSRLTQDIQAVNGDKHLQVLRFKEGTNAEDEGRVSKKDNYGFKKVEMMVGGIGYIDLREFSHPSSAGPTARSAMHFLANSKALIIDLRNNGGGWSEMATLLSSYLFKNPVLLSTGLTRYNNTSEETWTHYVEGPDFSGIPVFILMGKRSFSSAEWLAYQLQAMKRATIVGEVSKGGAHGIEYFNERELGISIKVSTTRSINPVTGKDWEKVGVVPDIRIAEDRALEAACAAGLDTLITNSKNILDKELMQFYKTLFRGRSNPTDVSDTVLREYVGIYENDEYGAKIELQNGKPLLAVQGGGPTLSMIPLERDKFELPGDYLLEMDRGPDQKIRKITIKFIKEDEVYREVLNRK